MTITARIQLEIEAATALQMIANSNVPDKDKHVSIHGLF